MTAAEPDFDSPRAWALDLGFSLAFGLAFGVLGPFGSFFNGGLAVRIAQWTLSSLAIVIVYGAALRAVRPLARRLRIPATAWIPATILLAAIPLSIVSRMATIAVWPLIARIGWLEWYGQALIVSLPATAAYIFLRLRLTRADATGLLPPADSVPPDDGPEAAPDWPTFLRRLPHRLGRDLLCLVMEDHYVRAHTPLGSELLLLPMRQAVAELEGVDGMQVHRSWWVARNAVTAPVEDGRNLRLRLRNGLEAPVARSSVARLREAGWI